MQKMKAIVKTQLGDGFVELQEIAVPEPQKGEVKIKIEAAGVCGTDIKILRGKNFCNPPVVLGHELAGTIEAVGEGVTEWKVGDRVVSETPQKVCGTCSYCKTGNFMMCPERLSIGYGVDGCMAEYMCVREGLLHRIPEGMDFGTASLCEPCAVACHAVFTNTKIMPYDTVLVQGPGAIGLLIAQCVKAMGATTVLMGTSKDAERLNAAKEIGIDYCLNNEVDDVKAILDKLTDGMGADVVFDATGAPPAIDGAVDLVKNNGFVVQVGLTVPSFEYRYARLALRSVGVLGTYGHGWKDWEVALKLLAQGKINADKVITHHFGIDEWEKAFEMSEKGEGIKILIHPNK